MSAIFSIILLLSNAMGIFAMNNNNYVDPLGGKAGDGSARKIVGSNYPLARNDRIPEIAQINTTSLENLKTKGGGFSKLKNSSELTKRSKELGRPPIDLSVTDFTLNQLRRLVGDDQAAQAEINEMSPEAAVEYLQGMAQEDINNPQLTEDTWLMPSLVYLNSKLPPEMRKEVEAKDLRGKLAYLSLVFGHELSQGVVKVKVASSSSPSPAKPKSALLSSSKLLNIKNSSQFNALSEEDKRRVIAKIQKEEAAGNQSKFSPSLQAFRDRQKAMQAHPVAAPVKHVEKTALQNSMERLKLQKAAATAAQTNAPKKTGLPTSQSLNTKIIMRSAAEKKPNSSSSSTSSSSGGSGSNNNKSNQSSLNIADQTTRPHIYKFFKALTNLKLNDKYFLKCSVPEILEYFNAKKRDDFLTMAYYGKDDDSVGGIEKFMANYNIGMSSNLLNEILWKEFAELTGSVVPESSKSGQAAWAVLQLARVFIEKENVFNVNDCDACKKEENKIRQHFYKHGFSSMGEVLEYVRALKSNVQKGVIERTKGVEDRSWIVQNTSKFIEGSKQLSQLKMNQH